MKNKIKLIAALIIFGYVVFSCTMKDLKNKKLHDENEKFMLSNDEKNFATIIDYKKKYDASTDWLGLIWFSDGKVNKFTEIYTSQIEDAFLINKPVLIFGSIDDFSNGKGSNAEYELEISTSSFEVEMFSFITPNLIFHITCSKSDVKQIISEFNSIHKII